MITLLPQNLFFDFDGTIADTSEGIIKSMQYAYDKLNLGNLSEERMRQLIGPTLEEIFEILTGSKDEEFIREAVATFRERYSVDGVNELCLYPGVEEALKSLYSRGYRMFIVTSKPEKFTRQICEEKGILKYFVGITGTAVNQRSLTKAERMKLLMDCEEIAPEDVIMVGDRPEDVKAANANNVRCIGASFGFGIVDELLELGCVEIFNSFAELAEAGARSQIKKFVSEYYEEFKKPEQEKEFVPGNRISYASRVYDDKEMCALTDATLDFWLTTGRFADRFEKEFASWIGVKYAHLVNSGSSANLLAFAVLTAPELGDRQIKKGDEVITVACGFPTTIAPILQYGAVPVFVDVTVPQYNIKISDLDAALSDKTKAVMIAHTLGNPFDIKAIKEFCIKNNLWLVEDNCDALGSKYSIDGETRFTGTWGDIGTSSFYPPHHMTMGEGGAVYTDNPILHRLILSYRDWGRDCICPSGRDNLCGHRFDGDFGLLPHGYDHKYVYSHLGYNLKVTDMQAAIGCEQLVKFPEFIERRRYNWDYLYRKIEEYATAAGIVLEDRVIMPQPADCSEPSWFGFLISIRPESGLERNRVTAHMEENNIQTRLLFSGNIIMHPCFDEYRGTDAYRVVGNLDTTEYIMNNTFWIGVYPGMTDKKLDYMAKVLVEAIGG